MKPRYCTNCERKIVVYINPSRNHGSYFHGKPKAIKDHDLCARCFRSMMESERAKA